MSVHGYVLKPKKTLLMKLRHVLKIYRAGDYIERRGGWYFVLDVDRNGNIKCIGDCESEVQFGCMVFY